MEREEGRGRRVQKVSWNRRSEGGEQKSVRGLGKENGGGWVRKCVYDAYLSVLNHFSTQPPTVPALSPRVGVTCVLSLVQQTTQSYVNWV